MQKPVYGQSAFYSDGHQAVPARMVPGRAMRLLLLLALLAWLPVGALLYWFIR